MNAISIHETANHFRRKVDPKLNVIQWLSRYDANDFKCEYEMNW